MRVNCGPAKRCVWPVSAPAQAFVRAGERRGNSECGIGVRGMSVPSLPFLSRLCPRFTSSSALSARSAFRFSRGFALSARLVLRFCRGDLPSVHARPSVSRAALPSARIRPSVSAAAFALNSCTAFRFSRGSVLSSSCPCGSGVTVCPQRASSLPFLARRFARGSRPAIAFLPRLCRRFMLGNCVSGAALPSVHPVRAILPWRFVLGARPVIAFLPRRLPLTHVRPSVSLAALSLAHPVRAVLAQPFALGSSCPCDSAAAICPQRASGLPFLARLCSRFTPGIAVLPRLCLRFAPSFTVLLLRFASVHACLFPPRGKRDGLRYLAFLFRRVEIAIRAFSRRLGLSALAGSLRVWAFLCGDLDGVAGVRGRSYDGNGTGGAAFVHFCVTALALQCFPRGVRWGCAPQTAPKSLRLSGLSSRCGGVRLVQIRRAVTRVHGKTRPALIYGRAGCAVYRCYLLAPTSRLEPPPSGAESGCVREAV